MTHDQVVSRLPWLANDSLEEQERREVETHLASCEDCRRELVATLAIGRVMATGHPSPEELVALCWGEDAESAIGGHVASCPTCASELELLRASRELERFHGGAVPTSRVGPRPRVGPWRRWSLVAAAVLLIAAGVSLVASQRKAGRLLAEQQRRATEAQQQLDQLVRRAEAAESARSDLARRVHELLAPQAGIALIELAPFASRRGGPSSPVVALDGSLSRVLLLLALPTAGPAQRYDIVALDETGKEQFRLGAVAPDPRGLLTISLEPAALSAGTLRIDVRPAGTEGQPLATYRLRVTR